MDLTVAPEERAALGCLVERGGSLPGAILARLCFDSPACCARTMAHLGRLGLVTKGRHTCYSPPLGGGLYYVLRREALGIVECGHLRPEWLHQTWAIRFNLALQELRFLAEEDGWGWVGSHRALLGHLHRRRIYWGSIEPHWPVSGLSAGEQLVVLWLFWQGLTGNEVENWERTTRELRQQNLLVGVALTGGVAAELRNRLASRNIRCPITSLEELRLPPLRLTA